MGKSEIINIVLVVLCAAVYGISMYFKTKGKCSEAATELIALIESSGLIGREKMAYVVEQILTMIPAPLKTVFTADRVERIAQEVFDNMKKYALEYLERIDKEKEEKEPEE